MGRLETVRAQVWRERRAKSSEAQLGQAALSQSLADLWDLRLRRGNARGKRPLLQGGWPPHRTQAHLKSQPTNHAPGGSGVPLPATGHVEMIIGSFLLVAFPHTSLMSIWMSSQVGLAAYSKLSLALFLL